MDETKFDIKAKQRNSLSLALNKHCERNILHRDMTYFAYLVFSDKLITVNDEHQITNDRENANYAVIMDDNHRLEDSHYAFILTSSFKSINMDKIVESKDYDLNLFNSTEYQPYSFTEFYT